MATDISGATVSADVFVCHSPKGALSTDDDARLHVWAGDRLADAAVRAGPFDWLAERSA